MELGGGDHLTRWGGERAAQRLRAAPWGGFTQEDILIALRQPSRTLAISV